MLSRRAMHPVLSTRINAVMLFRVLRSDARIRIMGGVRDGSLPVENAMPSLIATSYPHPRVRTKYSK